MKTDSGVKYLVIESSWSGFYRSYSLTVSSSSADWTNYSGVLYCNGAYIRYSSGWTTTTNRRNATQLSFNEVRDKITTVTLESGTDAKPEITVRDNSIPATDVTVSETTTVNFNLDFEKTAQKRIN